MLNLYNVDKMILGVVTVDLLECQVDRHPLSSRLEIASI